MDRKPKGEQPRLLTPHPDTSILYSSCPDGGTGRRKGLKIPGPQGCAGSIPALGTKTKRTGYDTNPHPFTFQNKPSHACSCNCKCKQETNAARDLAQFSARFGTPLTCASIVLAHCMQRARRKISRLSAFRLSELHAYSRYHFWASCSGTSPYSPLSDSKSQIPLFNFFARPI